MLTFILEELAKEDMSKQFVKIPLPNFSTFKSTKKSTSPYEMFHYWVAAQLPSKNKKKTIRVSASWLHPKDSKALMSKVKTWIKKCYPHILYRLEKELGYHSLDLGPANWREDEVPEWVEPGFVYVKSKELYE